MNSIGNIPSHSGLGSDDSAGPAMKDLDDTLRLLAKVAVPAGLEDRMFAGTMAAPRGRRVLEWPRLFYGRDWVRGIAAAAIVLAVGGGGWGIYAHVEPNAPAQMTAAPRRILAPGGFSSAEVIRRPQTLNGPMVRKASPVAGGKTQAELTTLKKPAPPAPARHRAKLPSPAPGSQPAK
jgi:hypothetical protein